MTAKRKNAKLPKAPPPPATTEAERMDRARALLQGPTLAANAIESLKMTSETDIASLAAALTEQSHRVIDGNLKRAESLLICQAQTLDALFNRELMIATKQDALLQFEAHMRCAFRAQSQGRATLETLATIKNPPVLIAKQANIAHGPQQVNNGPPPASEPSRARETGNAQNRLLEQRHGERLDTLTAGTASTDDPAMATVGAVHGAEIPRR